MHRGPRNIAPPGLPWGHSEAGRRRLLLTRPPEWLAAWMDDAAEAPRGVSRKHYREPMNVCRRRARLLCRNGDFHPFTVTLQLAHFVPFNVGGPWDPEESLFSSYVECRSQGSVRVSHSLKGGNGVPLEVFFRSHCVPVAPPAYCSEWKMTSGHWISDWILCGAKHPTELTGVNCEAVSTQHGYAPWSMPAPFLLS